MVDYFSQNQLKFKEFGNLNQINLNTENRWIKLAEHFPWDKCVSIFIRQFPKEGRKTVNPRVMTGSLIIKHKLDLSDEQTVMIIEEKPNRCDDRIVSIDQPWVRPIVRGKSGKKTEFGTKMGVVHIDGFAKAETMSWEAYNESTD